METQVKRYEVEPLTRQELNKLRRIVLGYGNFQKFSDTAEIPNRTLREVINRGYGKPETIQKIRESL
jgi:hypothetical protein